MDLIRLATLVVLSVAAAGVAVLLKRRRPEPPTAPSHQAPGQLDRDDFDRPDAPNLIVVFSSSSCRSCAGVWERIHPLESETVAVQNVVVETDSTLHRRYSIDGVPTTVLAGADGAVTLSYFGPLSAEQVDRLTL